MTTFNTTREKDDVLETEAEGRDADDELAARLEAGEVVSLGGKVLAPHVHCPGIVWSPVFKLVGCQTDCVELQDNHVHDHVTGDADAVQGESYGLIRNSRKPPFLPSLLSPLHL